MFYWHCFVIVVLLSLTFSVTFPDGYTIDDIQYIWKNGNDNISVEIYEGVTISQFNIRGIQTKNLTKTDHNGE